MWKSGLILLSISTSIFAAFLCEKGKLLMTVTGETVDPGQTYRQICGFLQDWQGVWQRPALRAWPESLESYPSPWLSQVAALPPDRQWLLDSGRDYSVLPAGACRQFFRDAAALAGGHDPQPEQELRGPLLHGIRPKKAHELARILPLLQRLRRQVPFHRVVDYAAGAGHLSRLVAATLELPVQSVDRDARLQEKGQGLLRRVPAADVCFHRLDLLEESPLPGRAGDTLSLGLHTCGPLALAQRRQALAAGCPALLNFSCCYTALAPADLNLSASAGGSPAPGWNAFALDLATRTQHGLSLPQFRLRRRVSLYRNSLHLLLTERYPDQAPPVRVGDQPARAYGQGFAAWARGRFATLGRDDCPPDAELSAFYRRPDIRQMAGRIFAANIIRSRFGRLLELTLLLDRCLWLQEQGRRVRLFPLFDESLSPRNLALTVV